MIWLFGRLSLAFINLSFNVTRLSRILKVQTISNGFISRLRGTCNYFKYFERIRVNPWGYVKLVS